jgi:hypothetical protein
MLQAAALKEGLEVPAALERAIQSWCATVIGEDDEAESEPEPGTEHSEVDPSQNDKQRQVVNAQATNPLLSGQSPKPKGRGGRMPPG